MQRFLVFILVVILTCIVLVKLFMDGMEPMDFLAAVDQTFVVKKPLFDNGRVVLDLNLSKIQMIYMCKLVILVVLVITAVYNYRVYVNEPEEN